MEQFPDKLYGRCPLGHNIAARELVAPTFYYKLDEDGASTTVGDSASGGNSGTASEVTSGLAVLGYGGNSVFSFDGVNQCVNVGSGAATLIASDTKGSLTFRVKPGNIVAGNTMVAFGKSTSSYVIEVHYDVANGKLEMVCTLNAATIWQYTSLAVLAKNTWYDIAILHNGVTPLFYINNLPDTGGTWSGSDRTKWMSDLVGGMDTIRIGCRKYANNANATFFLGQIADVRYFSDTVLTAKQMTEITQIPVGAREEQPLFWSDHHQRYVCAICLRGVQDLIDDVKFHDRDKELERKRQGMGFSKTQDYSL